MKTEEDKKRDQQKRVEHFVGGDGGMVVGVIWFICSILALVLAIKCPIAKFANNVGNVIVSLILAFILGPIYLIIHLVVVGAMCN